MTNTPSAAMLFAAGFGTRMRTLTRDRPKPLIPVADRALIDHALDLTRAAGIGNVVVNTHYLGDMIAAHLANTDIQISHETPEILDTGGGLRKALPLLGHGPVFTLNTDAIWRGPNPLTLLAQAWDPDQMDALLVCVPVAATVGHDGVGDFTADETGRIRRGAGLVYGGAQIVKTDDLADIDASAFSLNRLWDRMQARGRLFAVIYPGQWCDVGHPEGIPTAEALLHGRDV